MAPCTKRNRHSIHGEFYLLEVFSMGSSIYGEFYLTEGLSMGSSIYREPSPFGGDPSPGQKARAIQASRSDMKNNFK